MLLLLSMALVMVVSSYFTRRNVHELSDRVVQQAVARVELRIRALLSQARIQNAQEQVLLNGQQLPLADTKVLGGFLAHSLQVLPEMFGLGLGLQQNGDYVFAERETNGLIRAKEYIVDKSGQRVIRHTRWNGSNCELLKIEPWDGYDPRQRPFYEAAVVARTNVWTETYQFWHGNERGAFPGVTYATPLYGANGKLLGVLNADFELDALCRFLEDLHAGLGGYVFVVERRHDRTLRLIAHPDPKMLVDVTNGQISPATMKDRTAAAFVQVVLTDKQQQEILVAGHSIIFTAEGKKYFGSAHNLDGNDLPRWTVAVVIPVDSVMADVYRNDLRAAAAALVCLGLAALVALRLARRVAEPLRLLTREAEAIGRLELEVKPETHSRVTEIDQLSKSIVATKTNLRSFQKFVPADIVRELVQTAAEAELGGRCATLTLFFSDIANFTALSEKMSPEALVSHIGEYLGGMTNVIHAGGGTVDKFIGDGVMAFWGAPQANPDHARDACLAALAYQRALVDLRDRWRQAGAPELHARIGLHTGPVIVGNIGSTDRLNYTAIGDSVNLTSRIEGLNKFYGTKILVSATCLEAAGKTVLARPVDKVSVKGRSESIVVYELLGLAVGADELIHRVADLTGEAFAAYLRKDFSVAREKYQALIGLRSDDSVAVLMEKRCAELAVASLSADHDLTFQMREK